MPPTPARAAGAACVAVLALAGCTGGGSSGDGAARTTGALEAYFERAYGTSDDRSREDQEAAQERMHREVEELVAACMREQGFDYVPSESGLTYWADDLDVEWGSPEFAEQYGYGISTDPYGWEDREHDDAAVWEDPNQEHLEAMSDAEREAYYEALWGPPVEIDDDADPEEYAYDWRQSGCQGAAQHEVYEGGDAGDAFAGLEDEMSRLWEQIATDPRVKELDAAWASCMADAGYGGYAEPSAIMEPLHDEWRGIQGWDDPEYQALQEGWDWEAEPDGPADPAVDPDEVRAFTEREIATAVADVRCQEEVGHVAGYEEVSHELQQEFVDRHAAELDAWAEAKSAARGA